MPLFIGVHKWKPEEQIAIIKEFAAFFTAAPDGSSLLKASSSAPPILWPKESTVFGTPPVKRL